MTFATSITRTTLKLPMPLRKVRLTYAGPPPIPGEEKDALEKEAYQKGHTDASNVFQKQILEQREEMRYLQEELLAQISQQYEKLEVTLAEKLPELALRMVRKLAPKIDWDRELLDATLEEVLTEFAPQGENLEVCVCPADYSLLHNGGDNAEERHSGLKLVSKADLERGDIILRSRFGIIDAQQSTKLDKLQEEVNGQ